MVIVELIDLLPTVAALSGLSVPPEAEGQDRSEIVLYGNLSSQSHQTLDSDGVAFHQFPSCGGSAFPGNASDFDEQRVECNNVPSNKFQLMGFSVRDARFRFTRWLLWDPDMLAADWDGPYRDELYDHDGDDATDFDAFENVNLAANMTFASDVTRLAGLLQQTFDHKSSRAASPGAE